MGDVARDLLLVNLVEKEPRNLSPRTLFDCQSSELDADARGNELHGNSVENDGDDGSRQAECEMMTTTGLSAHYIPGTGESNSLACERWLCF